MKSYNKDRQLLIEYNRHCCCVELFPATMIDESRIVSIKTSINFSVQIKLHSIKWIGVAFINKNSSIFTYYTPFGYNTPFPDTKTPNGWHSLMLYIDNTFVEMMICCKVSIATFFISFVTACVSVAFFHNRNGSFAKLGLVGSRVPLYCIVTIDCKTTNCFEVINTCMTICLAVTRLDSISLTGECLRNIFHVDQVDVSEVEAKCIRRMRLQIVVMGSMCRCDEPLFSHLVWSLEFFNNDRMTHAKYII